MAQARADFAGVTKNLAAAYPEVNKGTGASLIPFKQRMLGRVKSILLVLFLRGGIRAADCLREYCESFAGSSQSDARANLPSARPGRREVAFDTPASDRKRFVGNCLAARLDCCSRVGERTLR